MILLLESNIRRDISSIVGDKYGNSDVNKRYFIVMLLIYIAIYMVLSRKTEMIIKDLKNEEVVFDFSNLGENHELFSIKNEKVMVNFRNS